MNGVKKLITKISLSWVWF